MFSGSEQQSDLLDIEQLCSSQNLIDERKETYFKTHLQRCHRMIEYHNKMYKKTSCVYFPTVLELGCPLFNLEELFRYLIDKLSSNGFKATLTNEKNVWGINISWAKEDINFIQYNRQKKKSTLDQEFVSVPQKEKKKNEEKNITLLRTHMGHDDFIPVNYNSK